MSGERIVLCMKWGTLYSADYVNVLYNAVRAHLQGDFRFVCLTEDTNGIASEIETYPIPDIGLEEGHWKAGAWPKLSVFLGDLYGLQGRALFIDLDTIIAGSLDDMFNMKGSLIAIDFSPWRHNDGIRRTGTGIFAFDIGRSGQVLENFQSDMLGHIECYDNEQNFLHTEFEKIGLGAIEYWPEHWLRSFKSHLRQPLFLDRIWGPKPPKDEVKIVCFHGRPRPIDLIRPPAGNWDVFPHYGRGKVDWMVDYWTRYGGAL